MAIPRRAARIVDMKLANRNAVGMVQSYEHMPQRQYKNTVFIDPRQTPRNYMGTLIHELLHICQPTLTEPTILDLEGYIAKSLWKAGYRREIK
jgi:hypothetical protein